MIFKLEGHSGDEHCKGSCHA